MQLKTDSKEDASNNECCGAKLGHCSFALLLFRHLQCCYCGTKPFCHVLPCPNTCKSGDSRNDGDNKTDSPECHKPCWWHFGRCSKRSECSPDRTFCSAGKGHESKTQRKKSSVVLGSVYRRKSSNLSSGKIVDGHTNASSLKHFIPTAGCHCSSCMKVFGSNKTTTRKKSRIKQQQLIQQQLETLLKQQRQIQQHQLAIKRRENRSQPSLNRSYGFIDTDSQEDTPSRKTSNDSAVSFTPYPLEPSSSSPLEYSPPIGSLSNEISPLPSVGMEANHFEAHSHSEIQSEKTDENGGQFPESVNFYNSYNNSAPKPDYNTCVNLDNEHSESKCRDASELITPPTTPQTSTRPPNLRATTPRYSISQSLPASPLCDSSSPEGKFFSYITSQLRSSSFAISDLDPVNSRHSFVEGDNFWNPRQTPRAVGKDPTRPNQLAFGKGVEAHKAKLQKMRSEDYSPHKGPTIKSFLPPHIKSEGSLPLYRKTLSESNIFAKDHSNVERRKQIVNRRIPHARAIRKKARKYEMNPFFWNVSSNPHKVIFIPVFIRFNLYFLLLILTILLLYLTPGGPPIQRR